MDIPHVIHNFKKAVRTLAKKERVDADSWGDHCARDLCIIMEHCAKEGSEAELNRRIGNMMNHYSDNCGPDCLHDPNFTRFYSPLNNRAPFYKGLEVIIQHVKNKVPKIWESKGVGKLTGLHALIVRRVPKGMFFRQAYPARVGIAIGEYSCGAQFFKNVMESYGLKLSPWSLQRFMKQFIQLRQDHIRKSSPANRLRITLLKKAKQKRAVLFQQIPKRPASQLRLVLKTKKGPQSISKQSAPSGRPRKCSYCSCPGHTRTTCKERLSAASNTGSEILR